MITEHILHPTRMIISEHSRANFETKKKKKLNQDLPFHIKSKH